jgi:30S ribosomal protein S31
MGRGDKRSKKGKIAIGTFGKARPARPAKKTTAASAPGTKE